MPKTTNLKPYGYKFKKKGKDLIRNMVKDKDISQLAKGMGIKERTLKEKIYNSRFTFTEILMLVYLCGYSIRFEKLDYSIFDRKRRSE